MNHAPLFFLHFPRTGGTTIDDVFFNNYPPEQILKIYSQEEFQKYAFIDLDALADIRYITGHLLLTSTSPAQFYGKNVRAFTFLREPVKRLHSEYLFLKSWKNQHLYEYLNANEISFSQYVASQEKLLRYRGKNFMTRCISGDSLEYSNISESLEKAKYNLKHSFMFFGIQERFMESMLLLSKQVQLKNILHQKMNALGHSAQARQLTPEEKAIAREYNQADIELYDYALNLLEERIREEGQQFQENLKKYIFINKKFQNISNLLYKKVYDQQEQNPAIELSKDIKW